MVHQVPGDRKMSVTTATTRANWELLTVSFAERPAESAIVAVIFA